VSLDFLDSMPAAVGRQRDLLRRLLELIGPDPAWRWFELSCSLSRGAGDELSDVDCGAGVVDWPTTVATVDGLVRELGPVIDVLHQPFGTDATHTFVQYADGLQLSLVVMPAEARPGLPPPSVALLDKDGRLATPWRPSAYRSSAAQVREWTFLGWIALADLAKYLQRGSLWEARVKLEDARAELFRLWVAGHDVDYPAFGLTSILETAGLELPSGIESTVVGLNPAALRTAARHCATLLRAHGVELAMGDYVDDPTRCN
jgi:hypothetical protein